MLIDSWDYIEPILLRLDSPSCHNHHTIERFVYTFRSYHPCICDSSQMIHHILVVLIIYRYLDRNGSSRPHKSTLSSAPSFHCYFLVKLYPTFLSDNYLDVFHYIKFTLLYAYNIRSPGYARSLHTVNTIQNNTILLYICGSWIYNYLCN
jgi:hypothetical protein